MKYIIQILIVILILSSCQSQDFSINNNTNEINIPGRPGPWLKHNGKYYCYFSTDNDYFSTASTHHFYILDKKGGEKSKIKVPDKLQKTYYDLYLKNDTIFTTEYDDQNTFYLDEKNEIWIETQKGIDLIYEDDDYRIYSLDFGEWGGVTWFEDIKSSKQFEVSSTTPTVNKLNGIYYLTTAQKILSIKDPKKLDVSKEPYNYKKAVLDDIFHRAGSLSTKGAIIEYIDSSYYLDAKIAIATSFISNDKLFHVYQDSISSKIGVLENHSLKPVYEFAAKIYPFRWNYDTRNQIQNNIYQTLQFRTESKNKYGIIEINENNLQLEYFTNTHRESMIGEVAMKKWFETSFDFYHSTFENIHLNQIDSIELNEKARDLTQRHKMSHHLLDGKNIATPRIYRKIEDSSYVLLTMYYYNPETEIVELIDYEWKDNNFDIDIIYAITSISQERRYKSKFIWLLSFLNQKLGKPKIIEENKSRIKLQWTTNNLSINLFYDKFELKLTMYKK